ncbi:hypothetical protein BC938DRAFT_476533 [Jimgerdemannia flammicorona]|uniref:Uncharacterized protein n=1 Tax=Jimgerdemannia flammicorona TaxID=994334 RepID=A0A433QQH0_9FUNG|nr:hypothetical protein BC938DRAFT_476533 [Jimgerdemannia flammicorona]
MILLRNTQRIVKVCTKTCKKDIAQLLALAQYPDWDLGVHLSGDRFVRKLNAEFRGLDRPTDILSFPFHQAIRPGVLPAPVTDDDRNLGDMFIAMPFVQRYCGYEGETLEKRLPVLFCHGIFHMLGYDHQTDSEYEKMREKEEGVLAEFWKWKKVEENNGNGDIDA